MFAPRHAVLPHSMHGSRVSACARMPCAMRAASEVERSGLKRECECGHVCLCAHAVAAAAGRLLPLTCSGSICVFCAALCHACACVRARGLGVGRGRVGRSAKPSWTRPWQRSAGASATFISSLKLTGQHCVRRSLRLCLCARSRVCEYVCEYQYKNQYKYQYKN